MRALRALCFSALTVLGCGCPEGTSVRIARDGEALAFCAEVAETEPELQRGLMDHPPLAPGEAMLFELPAEQEVCVHNRGVAFPIDVAYADSQGTIVAVEHDVPAFDETVRCHAPVQALLEVAEGTLSDFGAGDRLLP